MDKEEAQWLLTQIDRIVSEKVDGSAASLRSEMRSFHNETLSHFDAIYQRFDRLESEYQTLKAAVNRLESEQQALTAAVNRLEVSFAEDRAARKDMRNEIEKLKVQVADLQERIARLEADSHDA